MEKIQLTRTFSLIRKGNTIKLADPDPSLPPVKVATFYSSMYPELVNASVTGPTYNDKGEAEYKFSTTIGTKG